MMIKYLEKLSSNESVKLACVAEAKRRLREDKCIVPSSSNACVPRSVLRPNERQASSVINLWMPIGFHPWWHRCVKRAINRANCDNAMRVLLRYAFSSENVKIRRAWKNFLPANQSLFQY